MAVRKSKKHAGRAKQAGRSTQRRGNRNGWEPRENAGRMKDSSTVDQQRLDTRPATRRSVPTADVEGEWISAEEAQDLDAESITGTKNVGDPDEFEIAGETSEEELLE
jgi:hypothetical protein